MHRDVSGEPLSNELLREVSGEPLSRELLRDVSGKPLSGELLDVSGEPLSLSAASRDVSGEPLSNEDISGGPLCCNGGRNRQNPPEIGLLISRPMST